MCVLIMSKAELLYEKMYVGNFLKDVIKIILINVYIFNEEDR